MPRRPSRPITILAACGLGSAVLAAPASAPAARAHTATTTLTVTAPADGTPGFSRTKLSAVHGKIVLQLRNPSDNDHGMALGSKKGSLVSGGGISRITLHLTKGRYTYYCPVSDHRSRGMRGTLTVR